MNLHSEKLAILRNLMKENDIDLYIIPTTDPHLGENIPDHWRIVSWLTGFTGSSATVVITELFAGLWTDSRYVLQADKQLLDSEFILMKNSLHEQNNYNDWISENVESEGKIALDGRIFSIDQTRR